MREFTKAAISYGWASTCFQMQQMVNMFSMDSETGNSTATDAFNDVAESTASQLGPTMRSTYRAGDAMQRGMVNMMFGMAGNWVPGCESAGGRRRSSSAIDQSAGGSDMAGIGRASGFASGRLSAQPSWRQPRRAEAAATRGEPVGAGMPEAARTATPGWGPMP